LGRARGAVITTITAGNSFAEFDQDIVLRSAVERQFEIVGEALAQLARVDAAMAEKIPDVREIIGFRNALIHGYAVMDRARVWQVVQDDLPALRAAPAELLAEPE
jgi:uncharacterized protein with HEPN domain